MLRGSYAGGSLAVTARCPVRRSGPSATLHARVQAPVPRWTLPDLVSAAAIRRATPPPFAAVLLLRASALLIAVAWQSEAEPSRLIAERLCATPSPCAALGCFAFPSRTPLCSASPLRCRAGLRRRVILHFKAVARQISEELCLRLATLRYALATPCSALPSPRRAPLCLRLAAHLKAKPSLPVSVHRRCKPRLCFAVAVRCQSWPSYPMPLRIGSLPVLRGAVRFLAAPSPIASQRCSSFADLGLAGLLRRRAARGRALLFRRLPEQIKALPLQRPSPQRHRDALPSHANPLPPTASLVHRNAPLSRRYSGSEPSVHSKRPLPLLRHWPMPRNWP